jgi:hypothetical protein
MLVHARVPTNEQSIPGAESATPAGAPMPSATYEHSAGCQSPVGDMSPATHNARHAAITPGGSR